MKQELIIFALTAFFIVNTYYDGKYIQIMKTWKKYYQMTFYAFIGLSLYIFIKKYPEYTRSLFTHANSVIKYMPIDKNSTDILSPLLSMGSIYTNTQPGYITPQQTRMMNSGSTSNKRSVSETKKKYIAANQNWKCADCGTQLEAWYDIDHKIRLEHGGSNHINNLAALCKNCHGKKTALENML